MKGRPITKEEFDRIRKKAAAVVGKEAAKSWQELLDGLWWSGLRLGEALMLHWTDDHHLCVDLTGRRPMFRIQAGAEKGRQYRMLPMAPEFCAQLERVPKSRRHGLVFNPRGCDGNEGLSLNWVSKMIGRMGEKARVKVAERSCPQSTAGGCQNESQSAAGRAGVVT